ncbi:ArsC family reductase [Thiorhodococcus mannitoliphagus]|uniref:ArsC family reductase n=1 Tax=Thiorhodococcus mannitoliphagus TaxID=329406 RepID=A0A6P1DM95_9GAMM|nr:ArsC family reductase [Thiorhodococcus mannitoliphagus]NEX19039.1 ArsC family reductase [Thiorhodococcus mannitoliphagus]
MPTLYGIPNCGTVKKARAWLEARNIDYAFHDYKKAGLDEQQLRAWVAELGWEALLNRRGTTWRKLPESTREGIDEATAIKLMLDAPAIIRRPLLDTGTKRHLGFSEAEYEELLA